MRKRTVFAAIGVVLLAGGAAAVRYVALPAVHQLPSNVDTTVNLTGKMDLFDQAALLSGNAAGIINTDVPVSVAQHVKVVSTSGATAGRCGVVSRSSSAVLGRLPLPPCQRWAPMTQCCSASTWRST